MLGFLVWEFPTVYISQKTRVAKYLGGSTCLIDVLCQCSFFEFFFLGVNIVIWGIVLMLHSVGTSFGAFFALRFLLGTLSRALQLCNGRLMLS